ncbi:MAG: aminopeptidase P family protein [Gemmatimonadetes bacterium]|nr:aminopeptidase P family protein [Gemmatimonadota bacterium]
MTVLLSRIDLTELSGALRALGVDGWLIYDFHGINPVARRVLGHLGLGTRRIFVWLPAVGRPVAIAHKIELQPLLAFPGEVRPYATWQELHAALGQLVRGRRMAVEWSPEDAVPYLDRLPAGVVALLERLGGTIVSSAPLVTRFAARWSSDELRDHRSAAATLADIARATLREVVRQPARAQEFEVQQLVLERMKAAGLVTTDPPIVAFGSNAANPHYEPSESHPTVLQADQVVLLDLWGGVGRGTVFADQTWMGFSGSRVPDDVAGVWSAVRDARDAAVERLRRDLGAGRKVAGRDLDAAARQLITQRGYGAAFVHRTGHSIDVDLHGSGPHLDSYETDDSRELIPEVGFSVEPGIYLEGRFGVRSEINVVVHADGPEVTPAEPQRELILPG